MTNFDPRFYYVREAREVWVPKARAEADCGTE